MLSFASKVKTMDRAVTLSKVIIGQIFSALETSTFINIGLRFTASENLTKSNICNPSHRPQSCCAVVGRINHKRAVLCGQSGAVCSQAGDGGSGWS